MRFLFTYTLLLTVLTGLSAQVGVNNPNPEQALDVNGKIKLTDDNVTPEAGTIRYNTSEGDFEGHNGSEYISLTKSSSVAETARAAIAYNFGVPNNNTYEDFDQGIVYSNSFVGLDPEVAYSSTQFFMVEKIVMTPTTEAATGSYYVNIAESTAAGSQFNPLLYYRVDANDSSLEVTSNRVPILMVRPGRKVMVRNNANSPGQVRVVIYGVFVDDPSDYFGL
ncbi:hypothetical protein [Lewinella sp. 4G2]|uniref:hypothetical protein n=1 Tax=Lewinella sp. 4G2 TaxID=1803372 RepID=UPI0007B468CD|nr:hypothetical protein [Lewinella sp. 4G2]OAV44063.1 hypothetical protein A3850_005930 [Lewinella sp. 4G2]